MRDWLRKAVLVVRPWRLAALGVGLGVVVGAWILAITPASLPRPANSPTTSASGPGGVANSPGGSEPLPQAPLSAPVPTLVALESLQPTPADTPVPSPFAGIANLPAEPPQRTTPIHHTVAAGEVLWQIADDFNLRPETILWANDIGNPDLLLVGQDLLIPPTDGVLYTVRSGDSLADVANRYGVDLQAVIGANQLSDANQIVAGVDIFLPGGRPLAAAAAPDGTTTAGAPGDDQTAAANAAGVALPDNIDALLNAGWLSVVRPTDLDKTADRGSASLHQLPNGARLERLPGFSSGRIEVRDAGDGETRQAMTGWVSAFDVDVGRAPATRDLPQAYPADAAMDIAQVFAPYRSQLDGSPYAEANCGPTAVGMALDAFGISVAPRQLRTEALNAQHMSGNGTGTLITALAQVVQDNGLSAMSLTDDSGGIHRWSLDDIRGQIQQGHPVIVQVRYRSLPGRGGAYYFGDHYILITGVVGDGFLYNDPIDVDGLGWDRMISGATLHTAMNASDSRYAYAGVAVGQ